MNPTPEFKVKFGQIARAIVYEDELGVLLYVFDAAPGPVEGEVETWVESRTSHRG